MNCNPVCRLSSWPRCHLATFPCAQGNLQPQTGVCKDLRCHGSHWLLLTHTALGCSCVGHSLPIWPSPTAYQLSWAHGCFPSGWRGSLEGSPSGRGWCLLCLSGILQSCVTAPSAPMFSSKGIKHMPWQMSPYQILWISQIPHLLLAQFNYSGGESRSSIVPYSPLYIALGAYTLFSVLLHNFQECKQLYYL